MSNDKSRAIRPHNMRMQRNRNSGARSLLAALGASAALVATPAIAQETGEEEIELGTLSIEDRAADTNPYTEDGAPYKAKTSGDSRRTTTIAETPATISVLTEASLDDAGTTDLRETLRRQPGITLGTGENGNAFGDRYIIRGFEARSDVFVDGLRDPGMTTRETFAVEQVEVTKGPSSTFAGRGSTGGAVNAITKQASTDYQFSKIDAGVGTDSYLRVTGDFNIPVGDTAALRVNALYVGEDVPDRSPAKRERAGIAISGIAKPTDAFEFGFDYYLLDASGDTDLGTYIVSGGAPVHDIAVYAQAQDIMDSKINALTLSQAWKASDTFRIENTFRYGRTDNDYVLTGARGTVRDVTDPDAPGAATIGLSTHQGWQEVEYFVDQANAYWDTNLGGMDHSIVVGAEYSDLNVVNGTFSVNNTGTSNCVVNGRGGASAGFCIIDATGNAVDNLNTLLGREITRGAEDADNSVETISLYAMDTVSLTDRLNVSAGVRLDSFDYTNDVNNRGTALSYAYSDDLWNGHVGVVYDVAETGNIYFTVSSSSNINGGESDVGANCGYGGLCGTPDQISLGEPEQTTNLELGTKWNILDEKLLLTASAFKITKKDVMEGVRGLDYSAVGTLNTAEIEVQGVEFGISGNLTDKLSLQGGVTFMESEITKSASAASIGSSLANFADESGTLQVRYELTDAFAFGGAVTYSGEMGAGQPDSAASTNYIVPNYTVLDLFAAYKISDDLGVRLNVGNVTDENYYTAAYRSGAFAYKGDAMNARLTMSASF